MKILIVAPGVPNRFHRIRLKHIIDALDPDHKVTGCYLNIGGSPSSNKNGVEHIESKSRLLSVADSLLFLAFPQPMEVSYCYSGALQEKVRELIPLHDVIIVKRLRALQYVPREIKIPVIIDSTDAMSLFYQKALASVSPWQKPLYFEEWIKYLLYEKWASRHFKNWVVCSEVDAYYLKKILAFDTKIWVIPNVVDTKYYSVNSPPLKNIIVFSGLMEKYVNQSAIYYFLERIFPKIKNKISGVKLIIAGPNPPKKLLSYQKDNAVSVTGEVPDIRDVISKASVVVTPTLIGTGMRNKILQALSLGRPVVTTRIGAQGINEAVKNSLFIADDADTFADYVVSLLTKPSLQAKMAKKGKALVEKYYSLATMRKKYNEVIGKVVRL